MSYHISYQRKCEKVKDIVHSNCQITISEAAEEADILLRVCKATFTNILSI